MVEQHLQCVPPPKRTYAAEDHAFTDNPNQNERFYRGT